MLGIGTIAKKVFGTPNDRKVKATRPLVEKINALEPEYEAKSDDDLIVKTNELVERVAKRPAGRHWPAAKLSHSLPYHVSRDSHASATLHLLMADAALNTRHQLSPLLPCHITGLTAILHTSLIYIFFSRLFFLVLLVHLDSYKYQYKLCYKIDQHDECHPAQLPENLELENLFLPKHNLVEKCTFLFGGQIH